MIPAGVPAFTTSLRDASVDPRADHGAEKLLVVIMEFALVSSEKGHVSPATCNGGNRSSPRM